MELGRLPRVRTVANLMRKICYNNKDNLMAGLICGGWDPYEGGQIYEIPLGGTIMRQKFAIGGSGSSYIYGLVDGLYRDNMTKTECQEFVKKCKYQESTSKFCRYILLLNHYFCMCFFLLFTLLFGISHAMARDGSSGGVIRLTTIQQSGVERECVLGNNLPFQPNVPV